MFADDGEARMDERRSPVPAAGALFMANRLNAFVFALEASMWRVTDRLEARGEGGRLHIIVVMRSGAEVDYVLADGRAITRCPDGSFRLDKTGETLRLDISQLPPT